MAASKPSPSAVFRVQRMLMPAAIEREGLVSCTGREPGSTLFADQPGSEAAAVTTPSRSSRRRDRRDSRVVSC
jgi:hypothetical protein